MEGAGWRGTEGARRETCIGVHDPEAYGNTISLHDSAQMHILAADSNDVPVTTVLQLLQLSTHMLTSSHLLLTARPLLAHPAPHHPTDCGHGFCIYAHMSSEFTFFRWRN